AQVMATKAGLGLDTGKLEVHHLAGGDVLGVVRVLVAARRVGLDWTFERIAAMDLAKEDMGALLDEIRSRASTVPEGDDETQQSEL
ncbi:MAG TPA: flotillin-like FloA family protein, partial [Planctomycetota bacterium]|nr:flotillin-like FloA family protein [Planctomycetota bacterium]